jgi:hypothetical protein
VTTDAEQHAKEYHDLVHQVSVERPAMVYTVWSWDDMPEENRELLYEASRRFLGDGGTSAEQVAIAMMAEARKLHGIAERRVSSDHDVAAYQLVKRLVGWASDVRRLGVELAKERGTRQLAMQRMAATERRGSEAEATLRELSEEHYSGEASKLGKIRDVMNGWQNLVAVHQLANKIQAVLDD